MKTILKFDMNSKQSFLFLLILLLLTSQIGFSAEGKWIRVGMLHNFYQSHGSEPEEEFGDSQQFGMQWPAFWDLQDMQAARGLWFGVANYYDPVADYTYPYKVAHVGPRPRPEAELNEMMPVEFKLIARSAHPTVIVDSEISSDMEWDDIIDEIDPLLPSDRMIYNVINSSVGLSMERKIYAFSQQNYNNFFIYDMTFTNNGICNKDSSITHNNTLDGVYFYWQYRNAICTEGTVEGSAIDWVGQPGWGTERDMRWGINTMNEVLGENPLSPAPNDVYDDNGDIIRCFYSWHGRHSASSYDNIGSPNYLGWQPDGRLGASQYIGVVTIHADKSPTDNTNDQFQPSSTQYIESNAAATFSNEQYNQTRMQDEYLQYLAAGHPLLSQAEMVGDGFADQFASDGGYSAGIGFGPYTLNPGESVRIVLAEGVNGLSRYKNSRVGADWFAAQNGQSSTDTLPDGGLTTDHNEYKNAWVYTGRDSILKTFKRAINVFGRNYQIPQAPDPPSTFEVQSQGNRIYLTWDNSAENSDYFEGYKIFRAKGQKDSTYHEIFDCNVEDGNVVNEYSDFSAERGQSYYYYIVSYDDGTQNLVQPGKALYSSLFYTRTNKGATLKKPPSLTMDDIRIVPNPYNIRNLNYQYVGEPSKILFLNLPKKCEIKIFTERGDLIYTDMHEGSGDYSWNLLTSFRQIVVSGIYIATFYAPEDLVDDITGDFIMSKGTHSIKKFVVIR